MTRQRLGIVVQILDVARFVIEGLRLSFSGGEFRL